ncbi:unnamed protein product [Prunus armeniaca]
MAFERTWAYFTRCGELVVRGGLVVDVVDLHPFKFSKVSSETEIEGGLGISQCGTQGPRVMLLLGRRARCVPSVNKFPNSLGKSPWVGSFHCLYLPNKNVFQTVRSVGLDERFDWFALTTLMSYFWIEWSGVVCSGIVQLIGGVMIRCLGRRSRRDC